MQPAETPPAVRILQLATASWMSAAVSAMATLGVADALSDEPRSVDEVASVIGAHPPTLYRLLRTCADLDLVQELDGQVFRLTEVGAALRTDSPSSMRSFARWVGEPADRSTWSALADSVRTGRPAFELTHHKSIWDYLAEHPDVAKVFNDAMTSASSQMIAPTVRSYDFSRFGTIVDVGGGHGRLLTEVLKANPGVRGVLYDQPDVVAGAHRQLTAAGVARCCTVESGDFLDHVPAGGDAYLLSNIIHDWDDETSVRILANCRDAMKPDGRVLLVEVLMPSKPEPSPMVKLMDLNMLVLCGGKQRAESEFGELFRGAGLQLARVVPGGFCSVIEGVRATDSTQ